MLKGLGMEGCLVGGGEFAHTGFNGGVKVGVVGVVARVEGLLLHKHPEPLDEVQGGKYDGRKSSSTPNGRAWSRTNGQRW